jgi:von Willebrand factor type A domain-containing protein
MTFPLLDVDRSLKLVGMPEAWVVALLILPGVAFVVFYLYRREGSTAPGPAKTALAILRALAILLVLFLLFRPIMETTTLQTYKSKVLVLVDNSASMQRTDAYVNADTRARLASLAGLASGDEVKTTPRIEIVKHVLMRDDQAILRKFAGPNDRQDYAFADSLDSSRRLSELHAEGTSTRIGEAVHGALTDQKGQDISAILVVSDGQENDGRSHEEAAAEAKARGVPVYTVGVGDPDEPRDVSIQGVDAPGVALVNDEVIFEVTVLSKGFDGQHVTVTLGENGEVLSSADLQLAGDNRGQKVLLYFRPTEAGTHTYTIAVPVLENEQIVDNNKVTHVVNVIRRKIKVLFADGYPRWEYRYLKTALVRDTETVDAQCLLLSADPDFPQEASPGLEPLQHFPATREEIFAYDVILLGDVDPEQLGRTPAESQEILSLLHGFVEDLGGGLGMIAGESDSPRSYKGTPIESLLPVVLSDSEEDLVVSQNHERSVRVKLTDAGLVDPILMLEKDPETNRKLWMGDNEDFALPGFFWYFPVKKAKAGARVLAVHSENGNKYGPHVIIATQFYGAGRTFFTALDSSWRWRLVYGDTYFYRYWSQVVRFLATNRLYNLNRRHELYVDKPRYNLGEKVTVTAKVRDKDFKPSEAKTQNVSYQPAGAREVRSLVLDAVPDKKGFFSKTFPATDVGAWRLWFEGDEPSGAAGEENQAITFEVEIPSIEKENASLNRKTLETLSQRSGGEYVPLDKIDSLAGKAPDLTRKVPGSIVQDELWDRTFSLFGLDVPWSLVALVLLLGLEWAIRKRYRLL